ncbi:protein phosphatase, putative [Bodo saltans]|uniref:Serine/threonine-protein phosphatase n=1 Tax=Bodo saltans TaxID=75058 RepID=A0A0S4IM33_BODSA|nr:protein phosphatase, putative [Bodo saltans]|eukprot:CUE71393.1 protein phosphatase, putative [Bodo saltans]
MLSVVGDSESCPLYRLALMLLGDAPSTVEALPHRPVTVGTTHMFDIVARSAQPSRSTAAAVISLPLPSSRSSTGPQLEMKLAPAAHVRINGIRVVAAGPIALLPGDLISFGASSRNAVDCRVLLLGATDAHPRPIDAFVRAQRVSPLRREIVASIQARRIDSPTPQQRSPLRVQHPRRFVDPHLLPGSRSPSPLLLPKARCSALEVSARCPPAPQSSFSDVLPSLTPPVPSADASEPTAVYRVAPSCLCCSPKGTKQLIPTNAQFGPGTTMRKAQPLMTTRGRGNAEAAMEDLGGTPDRAAALTLINYLHGAFDKATGVFLNSRAAHSSTLKLHAHTILSAAAAILRDEPMVAHVTSPCWCCGDLHGSFQDLTYIIERAVPFGHLPFQPCPFVFLGDYVDRGEHSVEVVLMLLAWKVVHPTLVCLLRGNHEDPEVNGDVSQYGDTSFRQKCCDAFGEVDGSAFWHEANTVFSHLPMAAVVDNSVFLCHGGVPHMSLVAKSLTGSEIRLEEMITKLSSLCESDGANGNTPNTKAFETLMPVPDEGDVRCALRRLLREMVWNDPISSTHAPLQNDVGSDAADAAEAFALDAQGFRCNVGRGDVDGVIHEFSYEAVDSFLQVNGWSLLIRAHQHKHHGLEIGNHAKVLTLFSSCNYANENAAGACYLANGAAQLVSWRRGPMSPPRGQQTLTDTAIPIATWSCGLLPSSAHFSAQGQTANGAQSFRRGPSMKLALDTSVARQSPTPRCSPASDGTPRPAKTVG